jgi:hypothetical protein
LAISNLPRPTRQEYFQLFLVAAFPVHAWAVLVFLQKTPNLVLPLNLYHMLGAAAYVLISALLESLIVFGLLFLLSILLPARLFRSRLIPIGTVVILLVSISAVFIHLHPVWRIETIRYSLWAGGWALFGVVASIPTVYWVGQRPWLQTAIRSLADRLALVSQVYLFFDGLAILFVVIRNLA